MGRKPAGSNRVLGMIAVACVAACVPRPVSDGPRPPAPVDALLPSGRTLFAFDFARARYAAFPWPGPGESPEFCRALDSLRAGLAHPGTWPVLPAPARPFTPMRSAWGPAGGFYLLDRAGPRLGQYDSNAQFLSGASLPAEIRGRNLDAFQFFRARDGSFWFLDMGEGVARQFAELRSFVDQGEWRGRVSVRLPMGTGECIWEPYLRNPCCLSAQGGPVCFDAYFNPVGAWKSPEGPGLKPRPSPDGRSWMLELDGGAGCASPPVCFEPGKGRLSDCPSGPTHSP